MKTSTAVATASASVSASAADSASASARIDARIQECAGWRGETLARVRALIQSAVPEVVETWKWRGVPVWEHGGIICTGETYKAVVKLTFAKGAALPDPAQLFNASLEGNVRRAIDLHEGEALNAAAFKALVRAAAALNGAKAGKPKAVAASHAKPVSKLVSKSVSKSVSKPVSKTVSKAESAVNAAAAAAKPKLLSGGNPQIAMASTDAAVQAYIAAMPDWKSDIGHRLDALIMRHVPNACKAVKWNSPFYGMAGQGWFASFHVFANYVKLSFFKGVLLRPAPSGGSAKEARWVDIHEDDFNEAQITKWIQQAAALPGWGKSP